MGMVHEKIIDWIKQRLFEIGGRCWQTYPGAAWKGKVIRKTKNTVELINPVCLTAHTEGEPDLHAFKPVTVSQDMVGKTFLMFGKIEVKTKDDVLTGEQLARLKDTAKRGGFAWIVREQKDGSYQITEVSGE